MTTAPVKTRRTNWCHMAQKTSPRMVPPESPVRGRVDMLPAHVGEALDVVHAAAADDADDGRDQIFAHGVSVSGASTRREFSHHFSQSKNGDMVSKC